MVRQTTRQTGEGPFMTPEQIQNMIASGLPGAQVWVDGDGLHFVARVVCGEFEGIPVVKQHQMVYATVGDSFEGAIHALSIQTYTPASWAKVRDLQVK